MTDEDKLAMAKALTKESDTAILSAFLEIAKDTILQKAFPFEVEHNSLAMPAKYDTLQVQIAVCLYNKQGAEGEKQHSENGITRTYENGDIPESMLNKIIPYCKVIL